MSDLVPIVVFVYKRENHTRKLLESLAGCELADESKLIIYSDGAKKPQDEKDIVRVRELVHEKKWQEKFAGIEFVEATNNKGLANSIIGGVTDVIGKYGKVIVLEDDLEVAPGFLKYMNEMLDSQKDNPKVFSIAGWTYPFCTGAKDGNKNNDKNNAPWYFYRACSWGWATWSDRWEKVEFDPVIADYEGKLANSKWCEKFSRGGNDLPGMLQLYLDGKIDSWAIRWNAASSDLDMMTVYSSGRILRCNGLDGTGTNCSDREDSTEEAAEFNRLTEAMEPIDNVNYIKKAWKYESDTLSKKIKRNLRVIFVEHKVPQFLKR